MRTIDDVFSKAWTKNFPKAIQIETKSTCTAACTYCPYSETSKLFPASSMDDSTFDKIIKEISVFQPQLIAPYMNNEPLADKKIFDRLKKIRTSLPDTYIDFATNASLLDEKKAIELISDKYKIDEIKINFVSTIKEEYELKMGLNYDVVLKNVVNFSRIAKANDFQGRYRIIIVDSEDPERDKIFWNRLNMPSKVYKKLSRGGLIDAQNVIKEQVSGCRFNRQNEWMHIISTGDVVLCCMDWHRQHIFGNVKQSTLYDIWKSSSYDKIRNQIADSADKSFICNACEWAI